MSIARYQIGFGLHQSYLQLSTILPGVKIQLLAAGVIRVCDEACRGWLWRWRGSKTRSVNTSSTFLVAILVHVPMEVPEGGGVSYCVPKLQSFGSLGVGLGVSQFFEGFSLLFLNQLLTSSSVRHGTCYDFFHNPGHNNILVHKLGSLMPPRSVANSNLAPRAYHSHCASAEQSTVNDSTFAGSR